MDYLEHADGNPLKPVTVSDLIGTLPEKFESPAFTPNLEEHLNKSWLGPFFVLLVLMVLSATSSASAATETCACPGSDIAQLVIYLMAFVFLALQISYWQVFSLGYSDPLLWSLIGVCLVGVGMMAMASKNKDNSKKRQEINGALAGVLAVVILLYYFFAWK
jgi:uncharacterized membrane protein